MDSWEKSSGICRRFGNGLIIAHDGRLLLRTNTDISCWIICLLVSYFTPEVFGWTFELSAVFATWQDRLVVLVKVVVPTSGQPCLALPFAKFQTQNWCRFMPYGCFVLLRTRFWSTLMTVKIEKQKLHLYYTHNVIFQDITFCYLHMTRHDLQIIDTIDTPEYMKGELSNDGSQ